MYEAIQEADFSTVLTKRIQEAVTVLGKDAPFSNEWIHHHLVNVVRVQAYKSFGWVIRLTLDEGTTATHCCKTTTFEEQFSAKRFIAHVFGEQVVFRGDLQYGKCVIDNHSDDPNRPWFDD